MCRRTLHTLPALASAFAVALVVATTGVPTSAQQPSFTRADTLRGSNGPARAWWDVTFYDLDVSIHPADSSIAGFNAITYRVVDDAPTGELQIDLQAPLSLDSVSLEGQRLALRREGNAWFATIPERQGVGETHTLTAHYHGRPVIAANPPWDGGFIWARDGAGAPWVATANQGLGASVWWPNKDYQGEEPDSQRIRLTVPDPMVEVSNGRLRSITRNDDGTSTFEWFVASPVNNYAIAVNAGSFAHWQETFHGMDGPLTLDFWPLAENEEAARRQWVQTQPMLRCFEGWFGPYPWYEDGFKMIESPHLGMEHQSAIAYGNGFQNGYRGQDLSGTGQGLTWDFIIVHEAAHEWWGNNLTTRDVADMWVHEGFAAYAENLYTECLTGSKGAGAEYVIGTRARIVNDVPIIGAYGVQNQGSGDMYYKGANLLHTIRQLVDDDARWRATLRGLNQTFRHQIVTSAQVESYIARAAGLSLDRIFEQYLRTVQIPVFEWAVEGTTLSFRWADVVDGFEMPLDVGLGDQIVLKLRPTASWQVLEIPADAPPPVVDPDYYVESRRTAAPRRRSPG